MTLRRSTVPPHASPALDLARELGSDATLGLDDDEAARRLSQFGPNELPTEGGTQTWRILFAQFSNALVLILFVAIGLSLAVGHAVEAVVIAVIVVFSVALGFFQEFRAEKALEALRLMASPDATVVRGGRERDIPSREVVSGDLITLGVGDVVPADGRLVEGSNLQIDEAALTGESTPAGKVTDPLPDEGVSVGDRKNMVFASTAVTYGRGRAIVVATGADTEVGKIGALLRSVESSETPLEANLRRVGRTLAWGAGAVVLLVTGLGFLQGRSLVEMLIFGIALGVAVVPEALPAVVTISLALGARRMVRRNALIRRLPTVETLGSVTVIAADKTGTLTTAEMTVREIHVAGESIQVSGVGYEPKGSFLRGGTEVAPGGAMLELLECGALSTDAQLAEEADTGRWRVRGDPTEGAIVVAAAKAGCWKPAIEARLPRTSEIPFSSERKRMTTLHDGPEGRLAISKGAPEVVLASCEAVRTSTGESALDDRAREQIVAAAQVMSGEAMRVLAVARKRGGGPTQAEEGMTFLGLVGLIDPPRPEAKAAIETCFQAGIRPIMITGDHPLTARAIAGELGLLRSGGVVTGVELEQMDDAELDRRLGEIDVYARVSPADKLRVVTAFQRGGEVAAMTGDGVNDAPALKKADVGVAMGVGGTDVAKGAAAMILTDDNFASIVAAVEEGRSIFDNIKKYLMYLLSSNVGEIVLMAAAVALGLPLPLTAVQILYVNLATDGLPALALAVDPSAKDLMRRRPRKAEAGIFTRPVTVLILLGGTWSAFVNITLFTWALASGQPFARAVTMTFVSLVLIQFFKAYSFRSERHSILEKPFENRWLNWAILWELGLLVLVIYVPFLQRAFGTYALSAADWAVVLAAAVTVVPVLEVAKWMERHGWFGAWE
jgi:Ca2+-transporting ATPase